ncbi:MAG: hypothetical protein EU539_01295 [Promethearchaeota archaeon]|nr:MAG: hypothetical protein EU539_01295 [Candidatus Lokiarchaeota archaeon]
MFNMEDSGEFIRRLEDISIKDTEEYGNKASNLGELIKNKFSVPNGFVINTNAYLHFLEQNNIMALIHKNFETVDFSNHEEINKIANEIQKLIEQGNIPVEIIEEIKEEYDKMLTKYVVVRSSATAEDLATASFAGQYESYLNLKSLGDVIQNIKKCYASMWSSRAIIYRYENNISQTDVRIASIVQEMIPAKCAGVLFTKNPLNVKANEMVIESNYGLGESIVSGHCSPDKFLVMREKHHGIENYKIIDTQIGKKNVAIYPKKIENESGTVLVELSENKNKASSLTKTQIVHLSKTGTSIEKFFGTPQDIEWAIDQDDKIFILQSRPITSSELVKTKDDIYWTRGYADDYWNDPCTPLFFDLLGDPLTNVVSIELNSIMGYKDIDTKLLKLYNGHVYFNLDVLRNRVKYEIPKIFRNEDLLNYFPEGHGEYGKETMKNLPFKIFRRLFSEIRIMLHDPNGSMSKTASAYDDWSKNEFEPFCERFDLVLNELSKNKDLNGLVDLAYKLDRTMIEHYRLIRYGMAVHNIGMNLMLQYLLNKFLGKEETLALYPILISNLKNKLTETNDEIRKLVSFIQNSAKLKSIILEKDSLDLYNYILSEEEPIIQNFLKKFNNFLRLYGERGFSREVYYPRWIEAPHYVFDILKTLVKGKAQDFEKLNNKSSRKRKIVEKYVESKIRSQLFGFIKWKIYSKVLEYGRRYIEFREDQRFNLDRWIYRNRKVYLEIGKILTEMGLLKAFDDIFFLHRKEINALILENYDFDISSLINRRRDTFFKYEYAIPPKFLHGSHEFNDMLQYTSESHLLQGIPASQGVLTSKIRVLNKIEEIPTIQAGEILVVPKTDPGWTSVFSRLGGLITETGGILSHGAVVSREFNIPAVTNITNACQLFKTGQEATINGYNGTVLIKK